MDRTGPAVGLFAPRAPNIFGLFDMRSEQCANWQDKPPAFILFDMISSPGTTGRGAGRSARLVRRRVLVPLETEELLISRP